MLPHLCRQERGGAGSVIPVALEGAIRIDVENPIRFICQKTLRIATNQALTYSFVNTNSLCPRASAAVNRPFAVRTIIPSSLSPA